MLHLLKSVWTEPMVALFLVIVVVPLALLGNLMLPPQREVRVASAYKNVDFRVVGFRSTTIGWWNISHPVSLRMEQHKPVVVSYRPNGDWSNLSPFSFPTQLSVSVSGVDLEITPAVAYDFDINRIRSNHEDQHVWTVTPLHPGSHTLLFTFKIAPPAFQTFASINGNSAQIDIAGQLDRSLEVYSILGLPLSWDFLLDKLGNVIAFIAALPAFKFIVESVLKRSKSRRVRSPSPARAKAPVRKS